MGISHWHIMDSALPLIDNALVPYHPEQVPAWGEPEETEEIGCSVLLRGCVRTLFGRIPVEMSERKRAGWVEGFGIFFFFFGIVILVVCWVVFSF